MAPGEGREFMAQPHPREVAAVKDQVPIPTSCQWRTSRVSGNRGSEAQPTSAEVLGIKKTVREKRFQRGWRAR